MGNRLTPQDYCNMIVEYVNLRYKFLRANYRQFTEVDVYKYCLSKTEVLDKNDDVEIMKIVRNTLATLVRAEHLSLFGATYTVENRVTDSSNITVFEEPAKMKKLTSERIKALNDINVSSLSDDPMLRLGMEDDEEMAIIRK